MVDFSKEILSLDGTAIKDGAKDLTLCNVATTALLAPERGEELSGNEKMKRFLLAERIYQADGEVKVSAEEVVLLKTLIAKHFSALIVGRSYRLLEGG